MASVVKNVLKSIRENGIGSFIRELREEGYTLVLQLSYIRFSPLRCFLIQKARGLKRCLIRSPFVSENFKNCYFFSNVPVYAY